MISLIDVTEREYLKIEKSKKLFEYADSGVVDKFMVLQDDKPIYGFCWSTDRVVFLRDSHLVMLEDTESLVFGIHDKVYAFSQKTGSILFMLGLHYPLISIKELENGFLIISDMEVINVNKYNYSISHLSNLPCIILTYEIKQGLVVIKGDGGEVYEIEL